MRVHYFTVPAAISPHVLEERLKDGIATLEVPITGPVIGACTWAIYKLDPREPIFSTLTRLDDNNLLKHQFIVDQRFEEYGCPTPQNMTGRAMVGLLTEMGVVAKEMKRSYLNTGRERKRQLHEDWEVPEGFAIFREIMEA